MEHVHGAAGDHGIAAHAPGPAPDAALQFRAARRAGWRWGLLAACALGLLYGLTLSLANSPGYALDTFLALWYWMTPLVAGFALQVGLIAHGRFLAKAGVSPHASGVVASGGASALSMVACCAHHLADVLPLVGLAGAALFLSGYQVLFLLAGVLSNVVGITYLLGEIGRHRLYAPQGRVLAPLLRMPVRGAVPYVTGTAILIMGLADYRELWG